MDTHRRSVLSVEAQDSFQKATEDTIATPAKAKATRGKRRSCNTSTTSNYEHT
jgi:hypothetical protein